MIRRENRGDTIVEVLLAMAIVGLVLGAAFGIANRSVNLGQDAQERTEALKLAETQLELFKVLYAADRAKYDGLTETDTFCVTMTGAPTDITSSDPLCNDITTSGGANGLYSVAIVPPAAASLSDSYQIRILWDRIGSSTVENNVTLYFKPGPL